MRVLKFGGTSLANPERFLQAADIIEKAHLADQPQAYYPPPLKSLTILSPLSIKPKPANPTNLISPKPPTFSTTSSTDYMPSIIILTVKD